MTTAASSNGRTVIWSSPPMLAITARIVGIAERGHQIGGPVLRGGADAAGRRVLHRFDAELLTQASHRQLVYGGKRARPGERG